MSDKPILFSAPMVRALLAGTKTQTRRVMSTKPNANRPNLFDGTWSDDYVLDPGNEAWRQAALRIHVGDRLYVREAWAPLVALTHNDPGVQALADRGFYRADAGTVEGEISMWLPGIHQPRWASRLTLHVTDVRVQRLHDISEEDALAEGMTDATAEAIMTPDELALYASTHILCPEARGRILYQHIWDQINGTREVPEPWALNPWVAAYTFEVERANIANARAA